jgi:hypothetical protein
MSIKWAIGTVIAVLSAMLVLPGVASAHHPELEGSVDCSDGTFNVTATYYGGNGSREIQMVLHDGGGEDPFHGTSNDWAPLEIEYHEDTGAGPDFEFDNNSGVNNDEFDADAGYTGPFEFFEVNGSYYDLESFVENDIDIEADINIGTDAWIEVAQTGSEDVDFDECVQNVCINGDAGIEQLSFEGSAPTNDCGFINVCVGGTNGEVERMNEHDAAELGLEEGECDFDDPPEITTTSTEPEPEEPVEEVEDAVAEVSPAVDEVVALPASGYGDDSNVTYAWVAIFAVALAGLGGATVLLARPRK